MIHGYSYKPEPRFFRSDEERTNGRDFYFGIEIEMIFPSAVKKDRFDEQIQSEGLSDRIYLKEDGSIGHTGVEVVSFPMTLIEHQNYGWERILEIANSLGAVGHDDERCGIHIHTNRNWFSTGDIKKVMAFYDMNFRKIHPTLSRRRSANRIQRYCKTYGIQQLGTIASRRRALNTAYRRHSYTATRGYGGDRMHGINITNKSTIEFRFFQSTVKYESVMAAMELVDKICRWSKMQTIEDMLQDDTIDKFLVHAMKFDFYYVYLNGYLKDRTKRRRAYWVETLAEANGYTGWSVE